MNLDKTEAQIQADICRFLDTTWIPYAVTDNRKALRHRMQGIRGKKGWPDLVGCLRDGRFLAVEVKTKKGVLSEDQKTMLGRLERAGALVVVARCVDDVAREIQNSCL